MTVIHLYPAAPARRNSLAARLQRAFAVLLRRPRARRPAPPRLPRELEHAEPWLLDDLAISEGRVNDRDPARNAASAARPFVAGD